MGVCPEWLLNPFADDQHVVEILVNQFNATKYIYQPLDSRTIIFEDDQIEYDKDAIIEIFPGDCTIEHIPGFHGGISSSVVMMKLIFERVKKKVGG